jgi:hypothetical protein
MIWPATIPKLVHYFVVWFPVFSDTGMSAASCLILLVK